MNSKIKAAVDFGPLLIFLVTYYTMGILPATGAIMAATLVALAVSYTLERKIAPMPLVSALLIGVFGTVTLILKDPVYLVLKTTVFYVLASSALGIGLFMDRPLIKYVMGAAVRLPHAAWRNLTWRWIGLFVFLAAANILVWRVWGLDVWVNFKVWGVMGAIFLFALAQIPFMSKHMITTEADESA